jgi:hypothetical protein
MTKPSTTTQTRELEPCPFCGGEAILGMFNVWCAGCEAATKRDVDASAQEKIAAWNTRAPSDTEQVRLREALEQIAEEWGHPPRAHCNCPGCVAYAALQPKAETEGEQ